MKAILSLSLMLFGMVSSADQSNGPVTAMDCNSAGVSFNHGRTDYSIEVKDGGKVLVVTDGYMANAEYTSDLKADEAGYIEYKINPSSQDGLQADELSVQKTLLSAVGAEGTIWMSPSRATENYGLAVCKSR